MSEYPIIWKGEQRPDLDAAVRAELEFSEVESPDDLLFATVILTDDINGPSVSVTSKDGAYVAEYCPVSEWVTVKEACK